MDQVDLSLLAIVITLGSLFGVEMSEIYDKNALGDEGCLSQTSIGPLLFETSLKSFKNKSI